MVEYFVNWAREKFNSLFGTDFAAENVKEEYYPERAVVVYKIFGTKDAINIVKNRLQNEMLEKERLKKLEEEYKMKKEKEEEEKRGKERKAEEESGLVESNKRMANEMLEKERLKKLEEEYKMKKEKEEEEKRGKERKAEEESGLVESNKRMALDIFENLEIKCEKSKGLQFFSVPWVHVRRDIFNLSGKYFSDVGDKYKGIARVEIKEDRVVFRRFRYVEEYELMSDEKKKEDIFEEVLLNSKDAEKRLKDIARKIVAISELNSYLYSICEETKGINVFETRDGVITIWTPTNSKKELFVKSKKNPGESYLVDSIQISKDGSQACVYYKKEKKMFQFFFLKGFDCIRNINFEVKDRQIDNVVSTVSTLPELEEI